MFLAYVVLLSACPLFMHQVVWYPIYFQSTQGTSNMLKFLRCLIAVVSHCIVYVLLCKAAVATFAPDAANRHLLPSGHPKQACTGILLVHSYQQKTQMRFT